MKDLPPGAAPFPGFGRLLRRHGFAIAPEQAIAFIAAVSLLGPRSMADIREAAIATLAPPPERRTEFETLFRSHFHGDSARSNDGGGEATRNTDSERQELAIALLQNEGGALASFAEHLTARVFEPGGDGLLRFRRALASSLPMRRSLRTVRTVSRGEVDLRRSLRTIVKVDGDVPRPLLRRRQIVARKLLLLVDVSGSMKLHTADYLKIAHAAAQAAKQLEVFTFGTRLTRITPALRIRDQAQALSRAASEVDDWDGGTRIGPALLAFLAVPRFAAFARGAAIVIITDGLERGDHAEMEMAMRRLGSRSHRLSLATPLAGDPRFRPETAALRAILPLLDDLVDGSSTERLTEFLLSLGQPAKPDWRRTG